MSSARPSLECDGICAGSAESLGQVLTLLAAIALISSALAATAKSIAKFYSDAVTGRSTLEKEQLSPSGRDPLALVHALQHASILGLLERGRSPPALISFADTFQWASFQLEFEHQGLRRTCDDSVRDSVLGTTELCVGLMVAAFAVRELLKQVSEFVVKRETGERMQATTLMFPSWEVLIFLAEVFGVCVAAGKALNNANECVGWMILGAAAIIFVPLFWTLFLVRIVRDAVHVNSFVFFDYHQKGQPPSSKGSFRVSSQMNRDLKQAGTFRERVATGDGKWMAMPGARDRTLAQYGPFFEMYRSTAYWYGVVVIGRQIITGTLASVEEPRSSSASVSLVLIAEALIQAFIYPHANLHLFWRSMVRAFLGFAPALMVFAYSLELVGDATCAGFVVATSSVHIAVATVEQFVAAVLDGWATVLFARDSTPPRPREEQRRLVRVSSSSVDAPSDAARASQSGSAPAGGPGADLDSSFCMAALEGAPDVPPRQGAASGHGALELSTRHTVRMARAGSMLRTEMDPADPSSMNEERVQRLVSKKAFFDQDLDATLYPLDVLPPVRDFDDSAEDQLRRCHTPTESDQQGGDAVVWAQLHSTPPAEAIFQATPPEAVQSARQRLTDLGHWINAEPTLAVEPESQPLDPAVLLEGIWQDRSPVGRGRGRGDSPMATSFFGDMMAESPRGSEPGDREPQSASDGAGVRAVAQRMQDKAMGGLAEGAGKRSALLRHLDRRYGPESGPEGARGTQDPGQMPSDAADQVFQPEAWLISSDAEHSTTVAVPRPYTGAQLALGASKWPSSLPSSWFPRRPPSRAAGPSSGAEAEPEEPGSIVAPTFEVQSEVVFLAHRAAEAERSMPAGADRPGAETLKVKEAGAKTREMKEALQQSVHRIKDLVAEAEGSAGPRQRRPRVAL